MSYSKPQWSLDNWKLLRGIGQGRFGSVLCVKESKEGVPCRTMRVVPNSCTRLNDFFTILELFILFKSRFFAEPFGWFFEGDSVIFIHEFCQGGELLYHVRSIVDSESDNANPPHTFAVQIVAFYAAQIVLALDCLHKNRILYRDLSPDTVMLDAKGNLKLTGFFYTKQIRSATFTVCGDVAYTAPEVFQAHQGGYSFPVDWWSLGVWIYEMLEGYPPFFGGSPEQVMQLASEGSVFYPSYFTDATKRLLAALLIPDPAQRMGSSKRGITAFKRHVFFSDIDWELLLNGDAEPPIKPELTSDSDCKYFDVYPDLDRKVDRKMFADF